MISHIIVLNLVYGLVIIYSGLRPKK